VVGEVADNAIRSDIAQIVYNMTETGLTDAGQDEPAFEDDETLNEEIENPEDDKADEVEKDHISPEIRAAYKEKDFSNVETILIDAGHNYSGRDTGAENTELQIKEEDITWQIADKLRRNLEDMGYNVVMTREKITDSIANTSVLESLQARVDLGHQALADLFISIHCNAGGGSGTEVYCFQKSGYAGRLAELVQDSIASNTELYDRGVKTANFFVIQNTLMPAILVETGFIDNSKDVQILASEDGQQAIAEAIAESVAVYDYMDPIIETISKTMDNQQDEEINEETEQEEEQW
ncbi:MAG: N-acetylmuramoyl-L-alanine amidase, partial [Clostridia bacterium]|nr:N-acetylmuramoyl-L-alanine amidase [Clostridia bacterium]